MNMAWYFNNCPASDLWGPTVAGIGAYELPKQTAPAPLLLTARTLETYALVFLIDGRGRFKSVRGGEHVLAGGSAFWLFPGEAHNYGADVGDRWNEYWMMLSGEWMKRLEKTGIINRKSPIWQVGLPADAQTGFAELFDFCKNNVLMLASRIAVTAAKIILNLHTARLFPAIPDETAKMMGRARRWLNERIETTISIEQLAEELGISAVHFRRLFRQTFGQSVGQYVLDAKISRAQQLMAAGFPIKDVSRRLDFANVYYFTRIFKKKTSLPPHEWLESRTYTNKL